MRTTPWLRSALDQRALVGAGKLEGLLARNDRDLLVVIPRAFGFRRLLDLEQIHVAHEGAVLADLPVLCHEIVDRGRLHLFDDGWAIVAAGGFYRGEVV